MSAQRPHGKDGTPYRRSHLGYDALGWSGRGFRILDTTAFLIEVSRFEECRLVERFY
jgi:hypothetical protein